jgi:murein L,D-transpeptidase YcbB/YkuD
MMHIKIILSVILIAGLTGCATTKSDVADSELNQLRVRVCELESELREKDEEINYLQGQLGEPKEKDAEYIGDEKVKHVKTPKNIQTALKNAGFYKGPVDGKIRKKTKKAVKEFQRANGLTADGVVGKKTWAELKKYL